MGDLTQTFNGTLRKIRIVSNNICYGPCPEPTDEVEQHLTINDKGQVWFSTYVFGSGTQHEKSRNINFSIDKVNANRLLSAVASYFSKEYDEEFVTDIGSWELELTNTEDAIYKFRGSLCTSFNVDGIDLSDLIRDIVGMDDLFIFDGNYKPDKVNKITIDYHRLTKIKVGKPLNETLDYATWDYTEHLTIDRATESVIHIQNIGTACKVEHKYTIEGGVESLLDDLDVDFFFSNIAGNPADVVETPLESKDYVITIDFDKSASRTIQGSFDKNGLPEDFAEFAEDVFRFMRFYGFGEILDPSVYEKAKRRKSDYIFCSVTFSEGDKSYYYITDDDSIEIGDYVVVPAGRDNHTATVEVVDIEYFAEDDVPLPLDKTKWVIRKCADEEFELGE